MSITKYTTKAIVVEAFESGENDKNFLLFTRDFGLVLANGKSIRKLTSKLRSHMLPRSLSLVTLVLGKEVWRLVGSEQVSPPSLVSFDISRVIRRFIRGEGEHKFLFDKLEEIINSKKDFNEKNLKLLIIYITLVELGYADIKVIGLGNMKDYKAMTLDDLYINSILYERDLVSHINMAIKETQL